MKGASPATATELVRPQLPQLVPPELSLRLRQVPDGRMLSDRTTCPFTVAREFAADVERDLALTPKQLQSKYLYDALGSSLFDAICRLPWYRITRAEMRLLGAHADRDRRARSGDDKRDDRRARMRQRREADAAGGSARAARRERARPPDRHLVAGARADRAAAAPVAARVGRRPLVDVRGRAAHGGAPRVDGSTMLVLLLGSNIGNFDPPAAARFLERIRAALCDPGDLLLLGADLVKPERRSAARLRRPARRDGGVQQEPAGPDQPRAGRARSISRRSIIAPCGTAETRRIEMHLVSRARQTRRSVAAADIGRPPSRATSRSGPRARTSTSRTASSRWAADAAFATRDQWIDAEAQFALTLMTAL